MKQRLNHTEFDKQLKDKLAEGESMPPSFDNLFPLRARVFHFFRLRNLLPFCFLVICVTFFIPQKKGSISQILVYSDADSQKMPEQKNHEAQMANFSEVKYDSGVDATELAVEKKDNEKVFGLLSDNSNPMLKKKTTEKTVSTALIKNKIGISDLSISKIEVSREVLPTNASGLNAIEVASIYKEKSLGKTYFPIKKGAWFLGLTSSIDNTWIVNQNTYNEFDGYEFAYKIDWGYQYGIRVGYNPTRGLGFELGYIPKSTKGQRYEDIIHLQNKTREVDLEYSKIPFKLKWRHPLSKNNKVSLNWELGGAYTILHQAYQNNNGKTAEITNRFRSHVWQMNTGIMADFNITDRTFISAGFQGSISQDINAPKWQANDSYGKSHSLTLGLQLGISRRL